MPGKKQRIIKILAGFLLSVISMTACTKADLQYGSQLAGDQYTSLVMTDTFTTDVSTIYLDSFITSGSGAALIGSYYDEAFGQITASSYFQLAPPSFTDKSVVFDSIELVLNSKKTWYGDSTQPLHFHVYQLTQAISKTNSTSWYNYDSVTYDKNSIGEKTITINPGITDTVSIRLSDALGKQWLALLQSGSDEVSSASNFLNYCKGICIVPDEAKAGILSFSDSLQVRLHYKETSGTTAVSKMADFTLNDNTHQFNHITINRSGTALQQLGAQTKALESTATNNAGYMQAATGSLVKIRVPNIRNILQTPNYLKIERAVLLVKPVAGTYQGYYLLPDSLRLTTTDKNNDIGADISYIDGTIQYGELVHDNLYGENTGYTYDITSYLTAQIAVSETNENGLLLRPAADALTTRFNRILVGDMLNKTNRIQLQIYYLTVQ